MKISTILDQIDLGAIALPEFQRGYVWNRNQVRGLMHSLYRRHPVGMLLVWVTATERAAARGDGTLQPGFVELLLDGQQRVTSLYGIIRGKAPQFFEGNDRAFTGLYFDLDEESFEFYAPLKMKDNPLWIDVTQLMRDGSQPLIQRLATTPALLANLPEYLQRLGVLSGIGDVDLHVEQVTGSDKNVEVVVDIFNQVNSGGTKLSKGDLALAKVCASWPDARSELRERLNKWRKAGFHFRLEWLLRCVTTVTTGQALFSGLEDVDVPTFRKAVHKVEDSVDYLLNLISGRLGLDHDRVLGSRYSFPLMVRYVIQRGGKLNDARERDKLLFWYIHTFLWGRYAGSTESKLNQDLAAIEDLDGALDRLIDLLRQDRGDLRVRADDFRGWSRGARFYPLLYMLTRVNHALDWETGVELVDHMLGRLSSLQLHHIFPKSLLYKAGHSRREVNALANFTFLTQETNLLVSDRDPAEYIPKYVRKQSKAMESHWIPMSPELWRVRDYAQFLATRRELLAQAANSFLDSLLVGSAPDIVATVETILARARTLLPGTVATDEEERLIRETNQWVIGQDLPSGEFMYELADPESGEPLAILDLAWPQGLQEGYSEPVALLIDEGSETEEAANRAGYRYFTDADAFRTYVRREILALAEESV